MQHPIKTYIEWCNAILQNGVDVSSWEEEFTTSVKEQLEKYRRISDRQAEILEKIYSDKTP